MELNENRQYALGSWRTTKKSWVLDWVGSPPSCAINMGRDAANACDIHRGISGSTFFSYENILLFFKAMNIRDWEIVKPDTEIGGKQAYEYVVKNIAPRNTTFT